MINKTYQLNNITYNIIYVDNITNHLGIEKLEVLDSSYDEDIHIDGIYIPTSHELYIATKDQFGNNIPQNIVETTMWHELVHAILYNSCFYDESHNEPLVQTIALGIFEILKTLQVKH